MKCDLLSRNVRSLVLKNNLPSEYTFSSHVALVYKDGEENVFFIIILSFTSGALRPFLVANILTIM